jgi:hypothetical protein
VVDRRSAEGVFQKKVPGARQVVGSKHVGYQIVGTDGRVLVPNLTISRKGFGDDLAFNNVKGLADGLGMSLDGFIEASKCRVRGGVVTLCAAARVVERAWNMHCMEPIEYDEPMVRSLRGSVSNWLGLVTGRDRERLSAREVREIARSIQRLDGCAAHPLFGDLRGDLIAFARDRLGFV